MQATDDYLEPDTRWRKLFLDYDENEVYEHCILMWQIEARAPQSKIALLQLCRELNMPYPLIDWRTYRLQAEWSIPGVRVCVVRLDQFVYQEPGWFLQVLDDHGGELSWEPKTDAREAVLAAKEQLGL